MARLDHVKVQACRPDVVCGRVAWIELRAQPAEHLPQIFWSVGLPWREANLWLLDRRRSTDVSLKTVQANAQGLLTYANWLEETKVDWRSFPTRKADRCLVRYRGYLKKQMEEGRLAASTAASRMRVALSFYRWAYGQGLMSTHQLPWTDRVEYAQISNEVGLQRTIQIRTTDLSIPARKQAGTRLEEGLTPLSPEVRDELLKFASSEASHELTLMLMLGFFTGMRVGSICGLRVGTLQAATPDPLSAGMWRLAIGPEASPPVPTKFGITGQPIIPELLLEHLLDYSLAPRRLDRADRCVDGLRDLLFYTRAGNAYAERDANKSPAINVEVHRLRAAATQSGIPVASFKFHDTRATFGTILADISIKHGNAQNAVGIVKSLLLQKDERSALQYIRFAQKTPIKEALANQFSREFLAPLASAIHG